MAVFRKVILCPNCNRRVDHLNTDVDIVHRCDSNIPALDTESVFKIESANYRYLGASNKQGGKLVGIVSTDVNSFNIHGLKSQLYRQRQHFEHIDLRNR